MRRGELLMTCRCSPWRVMVRLWLWIVLVIFVAVAGIYTLLGDWRTALTFEKPFLALLMALLAVFAVFQPYIIVRSQMAPVYIYERGILFAAVREFYPWARVVGASERRGVYRVHTVGRRRFFLFQKRRTFSLRGSCAGCAQAIALIRSQLETHGSS